MGHCEPGVVYAAVDKFNRFYVGSTRSFIRRKQEHLLKQHNDFSRALRDKGLQWEWLVLEKHDNIKHRDLLWLEMLYQEHFNSVEDGYNAQYAVDRVQQATRDCRYLQRYGDPYTSRHTYSRDVSKNVKLIRLRLLRETEMGAAYS